MGYTAPTWVNGKPPAINAARLNDLCSTVQTLDETMPTKQDKLTFDNAPKSGSSNPVKSSGIKTALDGKAAASHTHTSDAVTDLVTATKYGPTGRATIQAKAGLPLKSWLVSIEPVQAGSGTPTPSNIRAISGRTGAEVSHSGKNLLKITGVSRTESGVTFVPDPDTGNVTVSGTATGLIYFSLGTVTLYPGTYTLSGHPGGLADCQLYDNTWTFSDTGNASTATITETKTFNFFIRCNAGVDFSAKTVFLPMLRLAAGTDAAFEPFKGEVFDVSFPSEAGTVYGGTLDVLKGTLTVDAVVKQLQNLEIGYSGQYFYSTISDKLPGNTNIISDIYRTVDMNVEDMPQASIKGNNTNKNIYIKDSRYSSVSALLAAEGGRTIVYKTAIPITYQLTPELVAALAGQNNFWADCGDVTVEYGAFLAAAEGAVEAGRTYTDLHYVHYVTAGQKSGTTLGSKATAEGNDTTASDSYAHAEGNGTTASNVGCHAEGFGTTASGMWAHAEGNRSKASGNYSHAEGYGTTASNGTSHAEGNDTTASGPYSHAEGNHTTASGTCSHAEGDYTTASMDCQHVFGKMNVPDTHCVEVVGWGTNSTQKNIRTLDTSGNMTIAGTLTQSSDAKLKTVEGEIPDVSEIHAVRFRWNDVNGQHDDLEHIGYIAQDVEKVAPFMVKKDSNGYKALDYIAFLCAKMELLERRVKELEEKKG